MKRFIVLFLFASSVSNLLGIGNSLDSMQRVLSLQPDDTNKVKAQLNLMNVYQVPEPSQQEAIYWGLQALQLSNKIKWTYGAAASNERLGRIYWSIGKYDSALIYHFNSLHQYKQLGCWKEYWDIVVMIGQDFANSSRYSGAIAYFNAALKEYSSKNNEGGITYVLSMLAWVYESKGDYVTASQLLFRKIKIDEKNNDSVITMSAYFDLASNYLHLNKYEEAEKIMNNWYPFIKRINSHIRLMDYYINKALIVKNRNRSDSAFYYYNKEKSVAFEIKNNFWIADAYAAIGKLYAEKKDCNNALSNLDSAYYYYNINHQFKELASVNCKKIICLLNTGKKQQAKTAIEEAEMFLKSFISNTSYLEYYQARYTYDSICENWQSAFKHLNLYHHLHNRIFNASNTQQMLEMQIRHEADKREAYLSEKNITVIWYLIILAVFTLSLAGLIIQLTLKNKKIKRLNDIQSTMLNEIHHRVKNNLQLISGFMQLQFHKTTDSKGRDVLEESIDNIHAVSLVHENLYNQTSDLVSIKTYVPGLCANINSIIKSLVEPNINIHCDEIMLNIDQTIPIGLMLNELITNSVKYAFNKPKNAVNKIEIRITQKDKEIRVLYTDNGSGFNVEEISKTSIGLKLIKMLVQELQGNYTLKGKNGFEFDMRFNIRK